MLIISLRQKENIGIMLGKPGSDIYQSIFLTTDSFFLRRILVLTDKTFFILSHIISKVDYSNSQFFS